MSQATRSFQGVTSETLVRSVGLSRCEIRTVDPDVGGRSILIHPDHVLLAMLEGGGPAVSVKIDGAEAYRGPKLTGAAAFFPAGRQVESVWPQARLRYLLMTTPHAALEELVATPLSQDEWTPYPDIADPFSRAALQELGRLLTGCRSHIDDLLTESIVTTLQLRMVTYSTQRLATRSAESGRLEVAIRYIEANLANRITLADLCREASLSKAALLSGFRSRLGTSPYAYVTSRRLERAKRLLATTDLPIVEVARLVGYGSQSHLTSLLSQSSNTTPRTYRLSQRRS